MAAPANAPPRVPADSVPWVTVEQMREVDRLMVEHVGVDLVRMVENAGRSLAAVARLLLGGDTTDRRVLVLAGPGGNGGGGLAAARHLHVAGACVEVVLAADAGRLGGVPAEQLAILAAIGVAVRGTPRRAHAPDLVVDALLGYGQVGPPSGRIAEAIGLTRGRRVLSLDVPSGLDPGTGAVHEPAVAPEATMTLAAPKTGLRARRAVGRLMLADISVPPVVWARLGVLAPRSFGAAPVVEISPD